MELEKLAIIKSTLVVNDDTDHWEDVLLKCYVRVLESIRAQTVLNAPKSKGHELLPNPSTSETWPIFKIGHLRAENEELSSTIELL